ncbi:helix-turn-helix transcriptional regulator [Aerococcus sp. 1KP-2016]|uniref:helix-turn-helix domain-containing protein n=1 Tax=Aerococcus sp. 1KP-2016 TaxID=1981982 RepID=UPI000B9888B3|nr:helix-turn-helix transcriptional regulator [Aerococcus sp. 1KP-2016]OYQ66896.1 hypothetical protein B9P78_05035 [Aerococcus sp. 1KP-2016]
MKIKTINQQIDDFLNNLSKMGITTRMISEDTGVSTHSLSNWRQGKSTPNQINLLKLSNYSLTILSQYNLDFPLKKELREPIVKFRKYVEEILREMPKKNDKENIIISDHQANKNAEEILKPILDFQNLDFYFNIDKDEGFSLDHKNIIDRKVEKQYRENFVKNFNLLIRFVDKNSQNDVEDFTFEGWKEEHAKEFYSNLPHDEDYDVKEKISSVAELWLSKKLNVSKTQILNWRKGKDFPSDDNLLNLKKLLRIEGQGAFLMYEFGEEQLKGMFLPSLRNTANKRVQDYHYYKTLEFFTNVLFLYGYENPTVKELKEDMEGSLIEENYENVVLSFFEEYNNMKVSRDFTVDEDTIIHNPELAPYISMDDTHINYVIRKNEELLNRIFTKENVRLLIEIGEKRFLNEQKEGLYEIISLLEKREGIRNTAVLNLAPKFRLLYSPDQHTSEQIDILTDQLAAYLQQPLIKRWFDLEYSFEGLTDNEENEIMEFMRYAMLNNNQELRKKVTECAVKKLEYEQGFQYSDLLILFDDLSEPTVIKKIFRR